MTDTYLSPWLAPDLTAAVRHDAIETEKAVAEAMRRFREAVPESGDARPLVIVSSPSVLNVKEDVRARAERGLIRRMRPWAIVIAGAWIVGTVVASSALGIGPALFAILLMAAAILFLTQAPDAARGIFLPALGRVDPWTRLPGDVDATDLSVAYAIHDDRIDWIDGDEHGRPMHSIPLRDVVHATLDGHVLRILTSDGSDLEIRDPTLVDADMRATGGDPLATISTAVREDRILLAA